MALYRAKATGRGTALLRGRTDGRGAARAAPARGRSRHRARPRRDRHPLSAARRSRRAARILGFEALLRWSIPSAARSARTCSSRSPRRAASSSSSDPGRCAAPAPRRRAGSRSCESRSTSRPSSSRMAIWPREVERVLRETGLDPTRLDLEITEGLLITDADRALAILERLKALGVKISMDDFGTGYSSLSYFRMFPFDKVKIDQSFIRDMIENPAGARHRPLGDRPRPRPRHAGGRRRASRPPPSSTRCVAEGCDQVQGYLISRPGPIEQFERVVIDRTLKRTRRPRRSSPALPLPLRRLDRPLRAGLRRPDGRDRAADPRRLRL
jgi:predicted signal transduction protein with EAL and GGDEF domain